ncbi:GTP pyrophosphokinase, partial [Bifidobacterium bifidum]
KHFAQLGFKWASYIDWRKYKGYSSYPLLFMVRIQVEALDRQHLLSDVTRVLADHGVNILSGSQATGSDRVAISQFSFEMADIICVYSNLYAVVRRRPHA